VRRAVEHIWNRGELDLADSLFAAAYVNHGGLISDLVHGPEAIKISVVLFRTAFPEVRVTIEGLTTEWDTVDLRWTAESTPSNARPGERRGRLTGTTRSSLAHGKIVESWTVWDHASALRRLHVVPLGARA
jgi:predicted ester cyclase